MGTWAKSRFDNDAALDWLAELEAGEGGRLCLFELSHCVGRPSCCISQVIAGRKLPLRMRPLLGDGLQVLP